MRKINKTCMYFKGMKSTFPIKRTQCQSVLFNVEVGTFKRTSGISSCTSCHRWNFFSPGDQCFKVFLRSDQQCNMEGILDVRSVSISVIFVMIKRAIKKTWHLAERQFHVSGHVLGHDLSSHQMFYWVFDNPRPPICCFDLK